MIIKPVKIGSITTENNLFFAPIAGFSDLAMRKIVCKAGASLAFTEMVSCKGLKYTPQASSELLQTYEGEKIKAVQIFGSDPDIMEWASKSKYLEKFDIIDINMGCPVPKIYNNGEGSALLNDLPLASKIIKAVCKSGKTVTVKTRIGVSEDKLVTEDFAKMCEDSGASYITVHGRTRAQGYSGYADWDIIKKVKECVNIPVIGNGDVDSPQKASEMLEYCGVDGVMIGRALLGNPWLLNKTHAFLNKEDEPIEPRLVDIKKMLLKHLNLLVDYYGEKSGLAISRKHICWYVKKLYEAKKFREQYTRILTINEAQNLINDFFEKAKI